VAVPDAAAPGGWRALTGDQVGGLLGAYLLERAPGPKPSARLVATTVVSSTMLAKVAAAAGGRYAGTLTGFKWIGPGRGRCARGAFRVRVRGGARLRRHPRGAGQGRDERGPGAAVPGGHGPCGRAVAAGPLGRARGGPRGPPDRAGHPADPGPGAGHVRAA